MTLGTIVLHQTSTEGYQNFPSLLFAVFDGRPEPLQIPFKVLQELKLMWS